MIYFCADDYGLCPSVSERIEECAKNGALNKVSCFPNFDTLPFERCFDDSKISWGLHINLVEGNALSDPKSIPLLATRDGRFRHTFVGLLKLSLIKKSQLEQELYREIKAQILFYTTKLPKGTRIFLDSHQHTHMIPLVFRVLMRVIKEQKLVVSYLRIPAEPIVPYLLTPSLYLTYSVVNLTKQWLLKLLWQRNKKEFYKYHIPTAYFMGILFSGHMDEKRVRKVLPYYIRLAKKKNRDIEVLFHPGYPNPEDVKATGEKLSFMDFYLSPGRKVEYEALMNLKKFSERSV